MDHPGERVGPGDWTDTRVEIGYRKSHKFGKGGGPRERIRHGGRGRGRRQSQREVNPLERDSPEKWGVRRDGVWVDRRYLTRSESSDTREMFCPCRGTDPGKESERERRLDTGRGAQIQEEGSNTNERTI